MVANFTIVHATLDAPQRWGYVFDKLAAAASFPYQNTQVCFFGHTHVPVAFMRDTVVRGGTYSKFKIDPAKKYFINVGAVGQPRDNNPKAAYVIYDMDAGTIELRRLEYDIATAQKKILAAGLPERLAERLELEDRRKNAECRKGPGCTHKNFARDNPALHCTAKETSPRFSANRHCGRELGGANYREANRAVQKRSFSKVAIA